MTPNRERTAIHEAAHATMAHLVGRAPGAMSIIPALGYNGICFFGRSRRVPQRDLAKLGAALPLLPATLRRSVELDVMVALAGPVAADMWWPSSGYGTTPDELEAERLVQSLAPRAALTVRERSTLAAAEATPTFESDESTAWGMTEALNGDARIALAHLATLREVTRALVEEPSFQRLVSRLARLVLRHRTVSARAVRAVFGERTSPAPD